MPSIVTFTETLVLSISMQKSDLAIYPPGFIAEKIGTHIYNTISLGKEPKPLVDATLSVLQKFDGTNTTRSNIKGVDNAIVEVKPVDATICEINVVELSIAIPSKS